MVALRYWASRGSSSQTGAPLPRTPESQKVLAARKRRRWVSSVSLKTNLLVLGGVIPRGDGDGLAVAGFDEFELALVHGFADRVEDERLGEGLLGRVDDVAEGNRHGGGDLGVERGVFAVFEVHLAVDERGVGAGGGLVEGPLEVGVAERDSGQRNEAVGARIPQAVGGLGEEDAELRGELGRGGIDGVGEFELQGPSGLRVGAEREREAGGWVAGHADGGLGSENLEAGSVSGCDDLGIEVSCGLAHDEEDLPCRTAWRWEPPRPFYLGGEVGGVTRDGDIASN